MNDGFAAIYKPRSNPNLPGDNATNSFIKFCLASVDESGKPTTGIVRVATDKNPFTINTSMSNSEFKAKDAIIRSVSKAWNPKKYLNVYVCSFTEFGISGYSSFPYKSLAYNFDVQDGVVMNHMYVGTRPFQSPWFYQNQGRTLIHEVGHWLGLFHTYQRQFFDPNNPSTIQFSQCTEGNDGKICYLLGDLVCDTPPVDINEFTYPSPNQCDTAFVCRGYSRQGIISTQNFMTYHKSDDCVRGFTQGQVLFMHQNIAKYRKELGGGRGDDSPVAGGRTEGCTTCETCKPITPKIIGNSIACDGEIVTYKLDAAEPYGCDVFWQVRGGEFIDYNGALGITIPYGTLLFVDSIRVKWNNIGTVHELLAVANRCDNVDAQSLGTIATKTVTIRPFKPLTFKNPTA